MQCPKCKDSELVAKKVKAGRVALDHCLQCGGLWFDHNELDQILGSKASQQYAIPSFAFSNQDCQCPNCRVSLYAFCYPGTMTLIDACKTCQGIWLDHREWNDIAKARENTASVVCPACHTRQPEALHCHRCGIVFAKFEKQPEVNQDKASGHGTVPSLAKANESTVADSLSRAHQSVIGENEIPGLKGRMLRFIDKSIDTLTRY